MIIITHGIHHINEKISGEIEAKVCCLKCGCNFIIENDDDYGVAVFVNGENESSETKKAIYCPECGELIKIVC